MKFIEALEGRRLFSITSEVLAASGVDPGDVGDIFLPDQPYYMHRNNRGIAIYNPVESARLVENTAEDSGGLPHGPVLAVGVQTPDGTTHVVATGNAL